VLAVDPSRVNDPEIAGESERDRLTALGKRFSREDLLRAFDLLAKAEADIRGASQPRYHLEMALLRWIYLRKLTPIEDLIAGAGSSTSAATDAGRIKITATGTGRAEQARPLQPATLSTGVGAPANVGTDPGRPPTPQQGRTEHARPPQPPPAAAKSEGSFKDALLAEVRKAKLVFYQTVVAQAQKIEVTADRVTFTFSSSQRTLREMFEQNRTWLESLAQQVAGRKVVVTSANGAEPAAGSAAAEPPKPDKKAALKEQALAEPGVQALLDVFPAEIRDVEEM